MQLTIAKNLAELQAARSLCAKQGKRVALVPTMGALHDGHISLIHLAKKHAECVVASIFVNPIQFGPNEDFDRYPRTFEEDVAHISAAAGDIVYAPDVADMYPEGFATTVSLSGISEILCGASRPGHFDGVATVVTKLLTRTLPHVAIFGEKDYQQLCVIRRLVADLDLNVEIIGAPIAREADGLAMSSRNRYLSAQERATAPGLHQALQHVAQLLKAGGAVDAALETGKNALTQAGFAVEYLELRSEHHLQPITHYSGTGRLLVAARLGKTRLIDNIAL